MTQKPDIDPSLRRLPMLRIRPGVMICCLRLSQMDYAEGLAGVVFAKILTIFGLFLSVFFLTPGDCADTPVLQNSSDSSPLISIPGAKSGVELTKESSLPNFQVADKNANGVGTGISVRKDPNQIVLGAVQQAVWGPSVHCRIKQTSMLGDFHLVGDGEYWAAGQGTGQLKLNMHLVAGELETNLIQVSDGRLVWTSTSDDEPPRRVFLDRIRSELGGMARNPTGYPQAALYLAIGGHAEMLRSLYFRYRWSQLWAGKDEKGHQVWQMGGTLRTESPSIASYTIADSYYIQPEPQPELPTDVRLTLDLHTSFPYQVDYFRREPSADGIPGKLIPVSSVTYTDVETAITMPKELFQYQVREDADRIEDETNDYVPFYPIADVGTLQRR